MTTTKNVQILEIGQPVQFFHNGTQPNMNAYLPALIEEVYEDESIRAVAFYRGTSMEVTATVGANDNGRPYIKLIGSDFDIEDHPVLKGMINQAVEKIMGESQSTTRTEKAAAAKKSTSKVNHPGNGMRKDKG